MPDLVTHWHFAGQVYEALPESAARVIDRAVYDHAAAGPDVWFSIGFWGGKNKKLAHRGNEMHSRKSGAFLTALAKAAQSGAGRDAVFSYLAGFLCHYALDTRTHPYIVCRTGDYDGTPETLCYRGAHTRLERAIDANTIRAGLGGVPGRFSITKRVLRLHRLPESLRPALDAVYGDVYGWRGAFDDLNAALRDQRRFYALVQDRTGALNALAPLLDDGRSAYDYRVLSYRGRELDPAKLDHLNESHALWHNAYAPEQRSRESFGELWDRAKEYAVDIIEKSYNYVYSSAPATAFTEAVGNLDYGTGLPCGDPRASGPGMFLPLFQLS